MKYLIIDKLSNGFTRLKCGDCVTDYLWYTRREMIQLFRKEYGLERKHLTIIEL